MSNKRIIFRFLRAASILLLILWMIMIFCFSARNADDSTEMSHRAGMTIGQLLIPDFNEWSTERQEAFASKIDHPVRKCAHATEYAVLGILWLDCLLAFERRGKNSWCISWALSALYACTDEYHQLFVPGRSGQITDVLIDAGGALAGVLVLTMILWIAKQIRIKAS